MKRKSPVSGLTPPPSAKRRRVDIAESSQGLLGFVGGENGQAPVFPPSTGRVRSPPTPISVNPATETAHLHSRAPRVVSPARTAFEDKLQKERSEIEKIARRHYSPNVLRLHALLHDIARSARQFELKLSVPHVGVIGMQSDGKSSFVEALLGFRFNVTSTELGTRRPLILQMKNDPAKGEPECRFFDRFQPEGIVVPVDQIESEIIRRTDVECDRFSVSPRPILLEVRYRYCATLTIYDFPGFRKASEDPLGPQIEKMVLEVLTHHPSMLIVCLEQSTVEWCNTLVRPIVQKVDSDGSRTIFVSTKFNNRINQFRSADEAHRFVAGGFELYGSRMFFMSLPSGMQLRNSNPEAFKSCVIDTSMHDYCALASLGFDHSRFRGRIGFFNLEKFLEEELRRRNVQAVQPILGQLRAALATAAAEMNQVAVYVDQARKMDVETVMKMRASEYSGNVKQALRGSAAFYSLGCGMTLSEERNENESDSWPHVPAQVLQGLPIRNSEYKIYGGAQLHRLFDEFEAVSHAIEFPETSDSEVAVILGFASPLLELSRAAAELAKSKIRQVFPQVLDVLAKRCRFVASKVFEMCAQFAITRSNRDLLVAGMCKMMTELSMQFVDQQLAVLRTHLDEELSTFTSVVDWDLLARAEKLRVKKEKVSPRSAPKPASLLNPSRDATIARVQASLAGSAASSTSRCLAADEESEETPDSTALPEVVMCRRIRFVAAKIFAWIRLSFVKFAKIQLRRSFVLPLLSENAEHLTRSVAGIGRRALLSTLFVDLDEKTQLLLRLEKKNENLQNKIRLCEEYEMSSVQED